MLYVNGGVGGGSSGKRLAIHYSVLKEPQYKVELPHLKEHSAFLYTLTEECEGNRSLEHRGHVQTLN